MELHEVTKKECKMYSPKEVSDFMGISYITLYRLVKDGKMKASDITKKDSKKRMFRFTAQNVQDYYDSLSPAIARIEDVDK